MMNVLGLSLVVSSLAAAGVFSPNPSREKQGEGGNTIVKEGHRVVVVEYDQGGQHNTKISYSSQPQHDASAIPTPFPKDLLCKHKIAHALHKKKEALSDALGKTNEYVQTIKDHVASNVSEARETIRSLGPETFNSFMGLPNLLGFATAYGMCVWVTFISSYVQSRAMPRQHFAVLQSKIYPVYFRAMTYSIALALLGHVLGHRNSLLSNNADMLQLYNLLASLLTLLLNSFYLEPRATKLMFERIKIEKEEGRGMSGSGSGTGTAEQDAVRSRIIKLNDKLKKFNSYSSLLNIINLMSLTWHLVYLAQRLHHTC
ncbi:transmembrane protein 205 [Cajanus cajan]|uniref:Transmembrane protein 205 family n=1 Tax=Cajanus cajan TaxID=3821 RepID=A0A151TP23_CAJCA|nr:transmembrane protein 205 [Cajanus cajan]KYP68798.1 Transmembrane protein 205 family [Cajanus cajan]